MPRKRRVSKIRRRLDAMLVNYLVHRVCSSKLKFFGPLWGCPDPRDKPGMMAVWNANAAELLDVFVAATGGERDGRSAFDERQAELESEAAEFERFAAIHAEARAFAIRARDAGMTPTAYREHLATGGDS